MKTVKYLWIGFLTLALAACSGGAQGTEQAQPSGETVRLTAEYEGALSVQVQLVAGTFMLEDTELAVSREQAGELTLLWKALRSLTGSDTAAEAEIEAVIDQIQGAMSAEQITAIAELQLTQEDLASLMDELDVRPELPEGLEAGDFDVPPGGLPGGGPGTGAGQGQPGGGNFAGPGAFQDLSEEEQATAEAIREESGRTGARAGSILIDPLIDLLQERAEV